MLSHRFQDEWILETLLTEGLADPEIVYNARRAKTDEFVEWLLDKQGVSEERVYSAVRRRHNVEGVIPDPKKIDRMALSLVPERICRRRLVLPLSCDHEVVTIAMARPLNLDAINDVEKMAGRKVKVQFALKKNIDHLLNQLLAPELILEDITAQLRAEAATVEVVGDVSDDAGEQISSPIIRLVDTLIAKAVTMQASDIHLEHADNESIIRFRIDGIMRSIMKIPLYSSRPVVSRIKIMSNLDVAEHRRPQDGRSKLRVEGQEIGLRVSILPTAHGETAVIRLLDKRVASVPFDQLGFRDSVASRLRRLISAKQGFVLVTGPTGSGKTTTLYSAVNLLKSDATNIVTVEDPIEYKLDGINQVQVNEKQGLTFAGVLRSVLRQDPNILLIGEIRDQETADVAFQAAMTGHMVLSTLHTNDTVSSIGRLMDMGVDRNRIASGLSGVTAQRLVRKLCLSCRVERNAEEIDANVAQLLKVHDLPTTVFVSKGCTECHLTGYKGRVAIVELLKIENEVRDLISSGALESEIYEIALEIGRLYTLTRDALTAATEGRTSLEEAMTLIGGIEQRTLPRKPGKKPAGAAPSAPPTAEALQALIKPAVDSVSASKPEDDGKEPQGKRRRILVVDDEEAIRVILRVTLERHGFEVLEAASGSEALGKVLEERPDMLLTDLDMPGLDGRQVVKAIRGDLGMNDLPIIVLTASAREHQREDLLAVGVNDYLTKPFDPRSIPIRVESVFARREA